MATKEQVDQAKAEWKTADAVLDSADNAADAALFSAEAAYDRYLKLKEEYENGSKSTED